ncbi:cwf18 pre-mRNA splicing factor-domain-containing protein [Boeremia exigua]|uniref:cwf18 pre-mRNA splicing factor-domain-containing protein n=1 Tax=Boeremia exigua TaxID=749465 RepID=UPI001E8E4209|nr:cwf18 pre-mRNA splicing factor-domain-containing protein [Boeremia exigua]KAH6639621.1 cwf18 pre-mRNA splicing factor-domain-containing protein [Boeremia exigua]
MSTHEHLSAASNDRKARLAQLKSLKRKQPSSDADTTDITSVADTTSPSTTTLTAPASPPVTSTYLSGRNFDPSTRTLKLGFEHTPIADPTSTLEYQAAQLALQTQQAQKQEDADAPLDLFKLQPKKPNWDLKRDLEARIREGGLERGFEGAVVRAVRERVGRGREAGAEGVGIEGGELVGGVREREVEEERERRREEVEGEVEG